MSILFEYKSELEEIFTFVSIRETRIRIEWKMMHEPGQAYNIFYNK